MATNPNRRYPIIALACTVALAVGAAALGGGEGQEPAARTTATHSEKLTPFIYGARGCATCHVLKNRDADTPEERDSWICRMDEFSTFNSQDKHKLAFQGLTGARGRRMSRVLGSDVTQIEACVNCHSVPERGVETQQYTREADGVTCVACHGPYKNWVLNHQIPDKEWNALTPGDKERRFGMTDLKDPVRRAETCASCHIGNYAEAKVVTHAMYAAGHPPLPSFEAATFGEAQPRHWEYLSEKSPARLKRFKPTPDSKDLERTRLVVIGGLVELRESMKLLADQAAAGDPESVAARWPDFARYDCSACHHELVRGDGASWRQVRRRDGSPGRPMTPGWPLVLVRLGIEDAATRKAAGRESELNTVLAKFGESLKARPFGDPASLVPAARKVVAWADSAIRDLRHTAFDAVKARVLLDRICKMAGESPPDYDSARQLAWAFQVIYREIAPGSQRDPAIEQELAGLEAELDLKLSPAGRQAPIETALPDRMRKAAEFDPASFQPHFARIAERLSGSPPAAAAAR